MALTLKLALYDEALGSSAGSETTRFGEPSPAFSTLKVSVDPIAGATAHEAAPSGSVTGTVTGDTAAPKGVTKSTFLLPRTSPVLTVIAYGICGFSTRISDWHAVSRQALIVMLPL
ncbi:hypothetical protein FQZ97_1013960 [compost metagenome]